MPKGINDMSTTEYEAFDAAMDNKDWRCDHDRAYTEDCDACDLEWAVKEHEAIEGEIVDDEPDKCDHGLEMFGPGYGKCAACDVACSNTEKMSPSYCYRLADGKKWRYDSPNDMWVRSGYQGGDSNWQTSTTSYKKKDCKHFMQEFMLDGEHAIYASAERDAPFNDKRASTDFPDLAVYLYSGWVRDYEEKFSGSPELDVPWKPGPKFTPPWPMAYIEWPDYGVPKSFDDVMTQLEWIWKHIEDGKQVETGCLGGHGRTGTLLACLMVYKGTKPGTAMTEVWERYCEEAIESKSQVELIVKVYETLHGKTWKKSKIEREIVAELLAPPKKPATTTQAVVSSTQGAAPGSPEAKAKVTCIHGRPLDAECVGCDYSGWC